MLGCSAIIVVVKVFWALWDNIVTLAMVMLLKDASYVRVFV